MLFDLVHECKFGHRLVPLKYEKCDCYGITTSNAKGRNDEKKYLYYCEDCGLVFARDNEPK